MEEEKLIEQYFHILKKIERIVESFRDKGYSAEQIDDLYLTLIQEIPPMILGEENVRKIVQSDKINNMSFEDMDELFDTKEVKGFGK